MDCSLFLKSIWALTSLSALTLISQQYSNNPSWPDSASKIAKTDRGPRDEFQPFGSDGFTFADLIDIINPLQHIPILSTFYRKITGDTIDPAARIAGGTLFGGPIGAALAVAGTAFNKLIESRESTISTGKLEHETANVEQIAGIQTAPQQFRNATSVSHEIKGNHLLKNSSASPAVTLRGGWIVNAAYQGKSSVLFEWARNPASEHTNPTGEKINIVMNKPRPPGGWIVNAAYGDRVKSSHKIII